MDFENDLYVETSPPISETDYSMSEHQKQGMVLFFIVTTLSVLFVSFCGAGQSVKIFCSKAQFCCSKIFPGESRGSQNPEQYSEDRVLAETLQRRLNEEERQRERLSKRKERRMWYEYYVKPWTMVVEKSDLFHTNGEEDIETKMVQIDSQRMSKDGDGPSVDSDIEEVSDDADKLQISQCRVCDEDDENATLYLKLRGSGRCVDGTCTFCLDEYEVGDEVVWSHLECPHVFHKECLMQWLSKGKKRCPICRHWFVPGSKIDDQKQSHGESWQRALSEMQRIEKGEEKEAIDEENKTELVIDLEQGRAEITSSIPSSQSMATRATSELLHTMSEHDKLRCNIIRNDSRDSQHLVAFEVNDIESHGTERSEERPSAEHDVLGDKNQSERKSQRQISFRSEELLADDL